MASRNRLEYSETTALMYPEELLTLNYFVESVALESVRAMSERPDFAVVQAAAGEPQYDSHHADTSTDTTAKPYQLPRRYFSTRS